MLGFIVCLLPEAPQRFSPELPEIPLELPRVSQEFAEVFGGPPKNNSNRTEIRSSSWRALPFSQGLAGLVSSFCFWFRCLPVSDTERIPGFPWSLLRSVWSLPGLPRSSLKFFRRLFQIKESESNKTELWEVFLEGTSSIPEPEMFGFMSSSHWFRKLSSVRCWEGPRR